MLCVCCSRLFSICHRCSGWSGDEYRHSQYRHGVRSKYGKLAHYHLLYTFDNGSPLSVLMTPAVHMPTRGKHPLEAAGETPSERRCVSMSLPLPPIPRIDSCVRELKGDGRVIVWGLMLWTRKTSPGVFRDRLTWMEDGRWFWVSSFAHSLPESIHLRGLKLNLLIF